MALEFGRGLFSGIITDSISHDPIIGATVTATNHTPPLSASTGIDGRFNLFLPADTLFAITIDRQLFYRPAYDSVLTSRLDTLYRDYALFPICQYMIGDINGNAQADGVDIIYAVDYLKGRQAPQVDCHPICPEQPNPFYAAGDVNGNCLFNGVDITFFVSYLKGQQPALLYCPSCPPPRITLRKNPETPNIRLLKK